MELRLWAFLPLTCLFVLNNTQLRTGRPFESTTTQMGYLVVWAAAGFYNWHSLLPCLRRPNLSSCALFAALSTNLFYFDVDGARHFFR
ncbi:hypothetical protein IWX92DRAFT_372191 [Phyllosticta citricarpa]